MASRLYEWISNSRAFPGSIPAEQVRVTAALNHAILLGKSGDLTRGLSINDGVIKRFRESSDETLLSLVADAMVNKGYVLEQLDRASEAISAYTELLRFAPPSPPFLGAIAQGLHNWAGALESMGQREAEVRIYDRIIELFGSSDDPVLEPHIAWALVNKAGALIAIHHFQAAVEACDRVVDWWGTPSPAARSDGLYDAVATAYRARAISHASLGLHEDVIRDVEELVKQFLRSRSPEVEEEVSWAMVIGGRAFEALERNDEANRMYLSIVQRYQRSRNRIVLDAVGTAARRQALLNTR